MNNSTKTAFRQQTAPPFPQQQRICENVNTHLEWVAQFAQNEAAHLDIDTTEALAQAEFVFWQFVQNHDVSDAVYRDTLSGKIRERLNSYRAEDKLLASIQRAKTLAECLSNSLGFNDIGLSKDDAVSRALGKLWELSQNPQISPLDLRRILHRALTNDLRTLRRQTIRHDPRFRNAANAPDTEENSEEKEGMVDAANDDAAEAGNEEHDETTSACEGTPDYEPADPNTDAPNGGREHFSENARFIDADLVAAEPAGDFRFYYDETDCDDRQLRLRTAKIFRAILEKRTAKEFDAFLANIGEKNRIGHLCDKDLLAPGAQFVFNEYGAGKTAEECLHAPAAKDLGIKTLNNIYNTFESAYKRFWKILGKLGFYWLDTRGAFRGASLEENERKLTLLSIRTMARQKNAIAQALHDLYNSTDI